MILSVIRDVLQFPFAVIAVVVGIDLEVGREIPEQYDVWIGSAPTLLPGDNCNPISSRINEYGCVEYYRKREKL